MTGRKPNATPEQIAAMLRDGATYQQIRAALRVSSASISAARKTCRVPTAPRALGDLPPEEQRAVIEARYPRIAAMLRDGATVRQILSEIGGSSGTVGLVRTVLDLPNPHLRRAPSTAADALTRYLQPYGDGHARWTGPTSEGGGRGVPRLWIAGRRYNPRHEAFRNHHGRAPDGPLTATCTEPRCIAGAHLADTPAREAARKAAREAKRRARKARQIAERQLDAQLKAIFGTDAR